MASNAILGKLILCIAFSIFLYYFFWIAILPFMRVEDDNWILYCFPPLKYAYVIPVTFGTLFVGSIMIFTMYHAKRFIWFF